MTRCPMSLSTEMSNPECLWWSIIWLAFCKLDVRGIFLKDRLLWLIQCLMNPPIINKQAIQHTPGQRFYWWSNDCALNSDDSTSSIDLSSKFWQDHAVTIHLISSAFIYIYIYKFIVAVVFVLFRFVFWCLLLLLVVFVCLLLFFVCLLLNPEASMTGSLKI